MDGVSRTLGLSGFWRWWGSELAPLVPAGARVAFQRLRTRAVLAFDNDRATLWTPVVRDGHIGMTEAASITLAGDSAGVAAAGRTALASAFRKNGAPPANPRIVVSLPARHVLRRTLVLPAAVEENLRQALAYDLDRHTPFKADELYFDAAVIERDPVRGEVRVDLAAARRATVDQALRHAESFGATVVAVVPDAPAALQKSRLNLLPAESRMADSPWRRWQFWLPIALLATIATVAVALPLWQKREYAIALTRANDEARKHAAVSEALRNDLERLAGDYNFVLERKYAFPSNLDVLNEVTRLLPDDTWLLQMEVKNVPRVKEPQRELLLRGESANAGRLVSAFEESKMFMQAAPRSPTTKIQPGPGEIFDLGAQVRPLTPPPAEALVADAASRANPPATPPSPAATAPVKAQAASAPATPATTAAPPPAPPSGGATAPVTTAPPPASTTAERSAPPPTAASSSGPAQ